MALTFFWRCEGTTLDGTHDFTAGDNSAAAGAGSPSISSTAARVGSNGVLIDDANEYYSFDPTSILSASVGAMACSFRFTTWLDGSTILKAFNTGASASRIQVSMGVTDELQFNIRLDGGTTVTLSTTAANLTANNWYGVVIRWNQSASDRRIEVYDSSGTLIQAIEDTTTAFDLPTGINSLSIGSFDNVGSIGLHVDNVFVGSAYDEPFEEKFTITSYTEYEGGGGGGGAVKINKRSLLGVG